MLGFGTPKENEDGDELIILHSFDTTIHPRRNEMICEVHYDEEQIHGFLGTISKIGDGKRGLGLPGPSSQYLVDCKILLEGQRCNGTHLVVSHSVFFCIRSTMARAANYLSQPKKVVFLLISLLTRPLDMNKRWQAGLRGCAFVWYCFIACIKQSNISSSSSATKSWRDEISPLNLESRME